MDKKNSKDNIENTLIELFGSGKNNRISIKDFIKFRKSMEKNHKNKILVEKEFNE